MRIGNLTTVGPSDAQPGAGLAALGTRAAGRAGAGRNSTRTAGVALLEVVLALALFFGIAVGILGGLSTCIRSAQAVRLEAQAADLAVTLLSEMQMDAVEIEDAGPMAYEDEALVDWTWEVVTTPLVGDLSELELTRVEIIIRNTPHNYTHRLYHLLVESTEEMMAAFGEPL